MYMHQYEPLDESIHAVDGVHGVAIIGVGTTAFLRVDAKCRAPPMSRFANQCGRSPACGQTSSRRSNRARPLAARASAAAPPPPVEPAFTGVTTRASDRAARPTERTRRSRRAPVPIVPLEPAMAPAVRVRAGPSRPAAVESAPPLQPEAKATRRRATPSAACVHQSHTRCRPRPM